MKHISLQQLNEWEREGREFVLIDVREPEEHHRFNIGGQLCPLSRLQELDELPADRPVVVYCKRGIRSQLAIQRWQLRFPQAEFRNLQGGVLPLMVKNQTAG